MGAKKLAEHAVKLINAGRDAKTPVAHISSATSANQIITLGTLEDIGPKVLALDCQAPALVIMGNAVKLSGKLSWREQLPLAGKRILVVGDADAQSRVEQLQQLGAEVMHPELFKVDYCINSDDWRCIKESEKVAFSDVHSVDAWINQLQKEKIDFREIKYQLIAISADVVDKLGCYGFYDVETTSLSQLGPETLLLGENTAAGLGIWKKSPQSLRFSLDTPHAIVGTDEYSLSILYSAFPEFQELEKFGSIVELIERYSSDHVAVN